MKKTKQNILSFKIGVLFGLGFVLVVALVVGTGTAHSNSDETSQHNMNHMAGSHCGTADTANKMNTDNKMGCMDMCDNVGENECRKLMDKDNDGICDVCG